MVDNLKPLLWFAVLTAGLLMKNSECRAVNLQNAWTLPQEEFSVFYRYFRDKISWYEADAVCQFHHADLVTIDNVVKFDAVRAFLKELDVTLSVWIGLRRQDNLHRFLWTNMKELDQFNSYWANELPLTEEPLCAYVDPISNYRWQAVRCGGPESSGFLCELPVPKWAVDCNLQLPSLTVQYLSDNGLVQLSRDCGELGTRNVTCSGKQERKFLLRQLQCTENENITLADVATTVHPAAKIISKSIEQILTNKLTEETSTTISVKALDTLEILKTPLDDSHEVDITKLSDRSIDDFSNKLLMDEKKVREFEEMRKMRAKSLFDLNDLMQGDQYVEPVTTSESLVTTVEGVETTAHFMVSSTVDNNVASSTETNEANVTMSEEPMTEVTPTPTPTLSTNKTLAKHIPHNPQIYLRDQNQQPTTKSYDDLGKEQGSNDHFVPPMMLVKSKYSKPSTAAAATEEETTTHLSTTVGEEVTETATVETTVGTTLQTGVSTSPPQDMIETAATSTVGHTTNGPSTSSESSKIKREIPRRFYFVDEPNQFWPQRHRTSFFE